MTQARITARTGVADVLADVAVPDERACGALLGLVCHQNTFSITRVRSEDVSATSASMRSTV